MPQCQGTTKAGERCKRDANQGSEFCGFHGDQADGAPDEASGSDTEDRSTDLLLIGVVAVGLFALKRLLRFL